MRALRAGSSSHLSGRNSSASWPNTERFRWATHELMPTTVCKLVSIAIYTGLLYFSVSEDLPRLGRTGRQERSLLAVQP